MIRSSFRTPALSEQAAERILASAQERLGIPLPEMGAEWCFYVGLSGELSPVKQDRLRWLLAETFQPKGYGESSFLDRYPTVIEIGPRLNFETVFSTTAVSICHSCGIPEAYRLERSIRYGLLGELTEEQREAFAAPLHDHMTQQVYSAPLTSFDHGIQVVPMTTIPVLAEGMEALRRANVEMGLAMDDQDLEAVLDLCVNVLRRDPTDVEMFQFTMRCEHSRHGFFTGKLYIDGELVPETLMQMVKGPLMADPGNSLIYFGGNSSALQGGETQVLVPEHPGRPSRYVVRERVQHPTLTAETHNHPTRVEPSEGAATGTGGRIRDNRDISKGASMHVGSLGICVGNLVIPGYQLPWGNDGWSRKPTDLPPLPILLGAARGAYGYANCTGEPLVNGYLRAFGINLPDGFRTWEKPILYTYGQGLIDQAHLEPDEIEEGMLIVQIGGPAYRIGVGGGPASSMIAGANKEELDFASVQRGGPAMGNITGRVITALVEMFEENPIVEITDLGALGDLGAVVELMNPVGGIVYLRQIPLGDPTLSKLEYWGNESQERDVFLVRPRDFETVRRIAQAEDCPCSVIGTITGSGRVVVHDSSDNTIPVDLPLSGILDNLPQKTWHLTRIAPERTPLSLPDDLTVRDVLERVLRLPSTASKQFLTSQVDRSVTGRVVMQPCVGPNHLPVADYGATARDYFGVGGTVSTSGEQPLCGLISPQAMSRRTVTEAILNMIGACITSPRDIKCEANWMLAAKLDGEGAWLVDAMQSLRDFVDAFHGSQPDGGKDSLTMAAKMISPEGNEEVVKAPGQLVIAAYATMPNIYHKVTPVCQPGDSLLWIDLSRGKRRLGGSVLAQVFDQVGDECPDMDDPQLLDRLFAIQPLIADGKVSAVHDISDDGLVMTLLEMAFASNTGLDINLAEQATALETLFSGEPGMIIAYREEYAEQIQQALVENDIPYACIGRALPDPWIFVEHNDHVVLSEAMMTLRAIWQETGSRLNELQSNPVTAREECESTKDVVTNPPYNLAFDYSPTPLSLLGLDDKPRVAIVRAKSSNGDREMAAAFKYAGFEPWDTNMEHFARGEVTTDDFQGVAFVGGFADGDVLDSAKGWAGAIRFNEKIREQFERFYHRPDTFSLGVCNGCQLMALLGWVPWYGLEPELQPRFIRNRSERFESRWVHLCIEKSPSIMLQGMEGLTLGAWVAHGEGRLHVPDSTMLTKIVEDGLTPIRFIDHIGSITESYPFNPNGSPLGITSLCSPDGRHLAMMPHAERSFLRFQWPYWPKDWKREHVSPWITMFQNARAWAVAQRSQG